jgi:hypothetical protein
VQVIDHLAKLKMIHKINSDTLTKTPKPKQIKHGRSKTLMSKAATEKRKKKNNQPYLYSITET